MEGLTQFSFNLHTIIMFIGPQGAGKSNFAKKILTPDLELSQTSQKPIKTSIISFKDLACELSGCNFLQHNSTQMTEVTDFVYEAIYQKLKILTSYPVNVDFIILDVNGFDSIFREAIVKIAEENAYNLSVVIFDYDDRTQYENPNPGEIKKLKRMSSGELSKKEFKQIYTIRNCHYESIQILVADYEEFQKYILPDEFEYVIIGDIHGCLEEFKTLLIHHGFQIGSDLKVTHSGNKKVVLVGDIIDKGYAIPEVVEFVYANIDIFYMVIGNHENLVFKVLSKTLPSNTVSDAVRDEFFNSIEIFDSNEELKDKFFAIFSRMKSFLIHKDFIVTHAPCEKKYLGKISDTALRMVRDFRYPKKREYSTFAEFIYAFDEKISFLKKEAHDSHPIHIFGHVMASEISKFKNKINIDTGCVAHGKLSSAIVKNRNKVEFYSVPATFQTHMAPLYNFF